ncbi:unnamed protein product [Bursaphelenchus okinawaensis]|uniref:Inositol polyphosphate-related phosphatase domain-containing protein n=1 Tax=Bursaphelenchus okinawaensis TaxID=465554 RepID=A0A811KI63_9BILA|nr:unnamed protein product [Bursaphelenchus okinawaensis]CAG9103520.1 unnamed protein product [Bursaphelenchus okinawaensis]
MMKWRLGAVTYNLCGKPSKLDKVKQLVEKVLDKSDTQLDGIVVSLQEVNVAERTNVIPDAWKEHLHAILWEKGYISVCSSYMMTNFLIFFVLRAYATLVQKCEFDYIKDRYYGVKGSICMSIDLKANVRLIFVGSHLIHGPEAYDRRVLQAKSVKDFVNRKIENKVIPIVMWLGDFNFRVTGVGASEFVQTLRSDDLEVAEVLKKHDQLSEARFFYDIFDTWTEANITFLPTYRMHIGSNQYDINRVPSWTDRILFNKAQCLDYNSIPEIKVSDHMPVYGIYETSSFDVDDQSNWEIEFDKIDYWYTNLPLRINFNGARFWKLNGSVWDWVGVYKVPDVSDRRFVTQTSVMSAVDIGTTYQVEFGALPAGIYFAAYHSYNQGSIQGMSNVFTVKDL